MQIILSTYPRSGSNFLNDYIRQCTDIVPVKTHEPVLLESEFKVVTIVRNPLDSIASIASMEDTFHGFELKAYIEQKISQYVYFYSNLDNVDLLLSYDDLLSDPSLIVDKVVSLVNANRNDRAYVSSLKNYEVVDGQKVSGYVISSKTLDRYQEIAEEVRSFDLSVCNDLYSQALQKSLSL